MDDLDNNEYLSLPDDPEEAFAVLHRRKFRELEDVWESNRGGGNYSAERRYVDNLVAFDEVYNLGLLTAFRTSPLDDREFSDFFADFSRNAEIVSQKIMMEAARRVKTGAQHVVVLDSPAREKIHAMIAAIRERLNDLALSDAKRESLFSKLNAFAAEVDRNRTRTEAFYAFAVETARVGRKINDEIKPLQETIDRLFDWLDKARDALPPWNDRKKIEGPPKRLPSPEKKADFDDDVPF